MNKELFWQEGIDGRRFALSFFKRIWLLPMAGLIGLVLVVGAYLGKNVALAGPAPYEANSLYRIWFDAEKYGEIQDYYNAYTWGQIMVTDEVIRFIEPYLPADVTKEELQNCVQVGQMNDIKVMPLSVTCADPARADAINLAYTQGLNAFAEDLGGLEGMQCLDVQPAVQVSRNLKTVRAAVFGFVLGAAIAFCYLLLRFCMDSRLLTLQDVQQTLHLQNVSLLTVKNAEDWKKASKDVLNTIDENRKILAALDGLQEVPAPVKELLGERLAGTIAWPAEVPAGMEDAAVLMVCGFAASNRRTARRLSLQLKAHDKAPAAAILAQVPDAYAERYYRN